MPRSRGDTTGEESHGLLADGGAPSHSEKRTDDRSSLRAGARALLASQRKPFVVLLVAWVILMMYLLYPDSPREALDLDVPHFTLNATSRNPPAALHLIVPANKKNPNLCKLMISAGALGYPDPVIINWNKTFEIADKVEGGSHLAKITGINDYLQKIPSNQDEDIVVMVDGYDVWLQLRPQTLVDRYFDLNRRADKRIAEELGPAAAQQNITQKIVFGTQKRCWPWTEDDPPCYAAPFSSLPEKIFGPDTDTTNEKDPKFPYLKFRPRYLNSGVMVGTVAPLRKLFSTAMHLMQDNAAESNFGSDQYIFSHIFGDQEVWREAVRLDHRTSEQIEKETSGEYTPLHPFNPTHVEEVRAKASNRSDGNYEFNIGLDTESLIGLNTVFAENDTDFLVWADKSSLRAAENYLGVPPSPQHSHMDTLPEDITDTVPPFWTFNSEPQLPRWKKWSEIPLFTNVWTGIVPAVIHHNAHIDDRKKLRETWWHLVWYQKFARLLYDAHIYEPTLPVAFSGYDEADGAEGGRGRREYWPSERWRGGGRNSTMYDEYTLWVRFEEICTDYHEEIFRDGKGPWVLPDVH